jgi:hypothetical protein
MGETDIEDFKFNLTTLKTLSKYVPVYHEGQDTLFIRPEKPLPATSVDWNGEVWIRVSLDTGDIIGLEIEYFESVFLNKHPEVAKVWKDVKPYCTRRKVKVHDYDICESFIRMIIELLNDIFRNNPQQATFSIR